MKKFLALLLALIMVLGMVACGTTTETETKTETKEETKTETTETKEETKEEETTEETTEEEWPLVEASALVFTSTGFTPPAESDGVAHLRDKYGLDLEVLPVDISTTEAWNMFWAGGGYADIIVPYGGSQSRQIITDGSCRTIEYDWIKEYMPRLYTLLLRIYGNDEAILKDLNINGETWCIPYFFEGSLVAFSTAFRTEWLENLGLEVYNGMTVEELEEIVRAFAEDDPDGNGIDDTFAFTGGHSYGVYSLAAAYGTAPTTGFYQSDDGTYMYTNINTDEHRNYLAKLAEWYQAGWIDPEFLTDDRTTTRQKFANGNVGIYSDHPSWWPVTQGETAPMQQLVATQNLDYATACQFVTDFSSEIDGQPMHNSEYGWINGQASVYFGYEASDEVVIRMMQVIDAAVRLWTFDEEDIAAIREFSTRTDGVEGVHWELDETGRPVQLQSLDATAKSEMGLYIFPNANGLDLGCYEGREDEFVIDMYKLGMADNRICKGYNCTLPTLDGKVADQYTNVTDYASTCRGQFISGELDITDDTVWAEYLATLDEYGLQDILAAYEEHFGM